MKLKIKKSKDSTAAGFEPTREFPKGFQEIEKLF